MIELSLTNLGAYSGQILIVVALAAAAARLLDIPLPRVRMAYWRTVVIVCLALPLVALAQPSVPVISAVAPVTAASSQISGQPTGTIGGTSAVRDASVPSPPLSVYITILLAAGVVGRGLWLSIGLARLRSLRRHSSPFLLDSEMESLRADIAPHADIRCGSHARQPATFGLRRPVILLPDSINEAPAAERTAIVCHELMHVRRRDWVWTLAEEVLRTLFWFHPAMRYAISRVQATREEVVDADVIARTGARHEYMRALVTFADHSGLLPAPSFVRRNQLRTRLRRISEEVLMSRLRLRTAVTALAGVLVVAVALAASGLRYELVAQQPVQAGPPDAVQFSAPVARAIVRLDRPVYPPTAWRAGIGAVVTLTIRIEPNGLVTIERQPTWEVTVTSTSPADAVQNFWATQGWTDFVRAATEAIGRWQYAPAESPVTVPVRVTFTATPNSRLMFTSTDGRRVYFSGNDANRSGPGTRSGQAPVRVGGNVRPPTKIVHAAPVYPETARAARVQGVVIVEAVIGVDGAIAEARVLRSIPLLDEAALDAVYQWRFEPTYVDGAARDVIMTVTVNFTLPEPQ